MSGRSFNRQVSPDSSVVAVIRIGKRYRGADVVSSRSAGDDSISSSDLAIGRSLPSESGTSPGSLYRVKDLRAGDLLLRKESAGCRNQSTNPILCPKRRPNWPSRPLDQQSKAVRDLRQPLAHLRSAVRDVVAQ